MSKLYMIVRADDVTSRTRDVDLHGPFRSEKGNYDCRKKFYNMETGLKIRTEVSSIIYDY